MPLRPLNYAIPEQQCCVTACKGTTINLTDNYSCVYQEIKVLASKCSFVLMRLPCYRSSMNSVCFGAVYFSGLSDLTVPLW